MKQSQQILQLWAAAEEAGESAVLATVVKTRGSAYRLPGARLLITESGRRAGSVSGGCLEDDLVKKAWWFTENGPVIRRYDTTPDGDIGSAPFGLGCNGIVYVRLERLYPGQADALELMRRVRATRSPAALAHILEPSELVAQSLTVSAEDVVHSTVEDARLAALLQTEARSAIARGRSRTVAESGIEAFVETVTPPVRLLVFGAGDDAVPLTDVANYLGWQVSVYDGRAHYARTEKFPNAHHVSVRSPGLAAQVPLDPWTVAVVMHHSYSQDLEVLTELSTRPLRYLGILGPRNRTTQLLADAGLSPDTLAASLHSPIGLDIGADGPEQVALSVVAEIQASLNGREGGLLRQRAGSIHSEAGSPSAAEPFTVRSIACA